MCERSFGDFEGDASFGLPFDFAADLAFAACSAPLSLPLVLLRPRELDLSLLLLLLLPLLLLPLFWLPFSLLPLFGRFTKLGTAPRART